MRAVPLLLVFAALSWTPSAAAQPILGDGGPQVDAVEIVVGCVTASFREVPPAEKPPEDDPPREEPSVEEPPREEPPRTPWNASVSIDVDRCVRDALGEACGPLGMACCELTDERPCQAYSSIGGPGFQVGHRLPTGGGVCVTVSTSPSLNASAETRHCWERPITGSAGARVDAA